MKTRRFRPSRCAAAVAAACAALSGAPAAAADFTCAWASAASFAWNTASAWNNCNGTFPNSTASDNYSAVINVAGTAYTVSLNTAARVKDLTLNSSSATLSLGNVLTLDGTATVQAGTLRFNGGGLRGGILELASPTLVSFISSGSNVLDGVAVRGAITMSSGYLRALNGTSFAGAGGVGPGTVNLSGGGTFFGFDGDAAGWSGSVDNVTFNLSSGAYLTIDRGANFTFGSGVTVRGTGNVGNSWVQASGPASTLTTSGLISADVASSTLTLGVASTYLTTITNASGGIVEARNGGTLNIQATNLSNAGLIRVVNGGTLNIQATNLSNAGLIRVVDGTSTVRIGSNVTTAGLGRFRNDAGGSLQLAGTLDNTGQTLHFSPAGDENRGTLTLQGGRIVGGTVQQVGANGLRFSSSTGTLDAVTVRGDLQLTGSSERLTLLNGVTLTNEAGSGPGVANVTGSSAYLNFDGAAVGWTQTFDNATVNLGTTSNYGYLTVSRGGTLTLGPNVTVRGYGGVGNTWLTASGAASLVNQGTISADLNGRQMDLGATSAGSGVNTLTNAATGFLEARNGSTLNIQATNLSNAGLIRVVDGTSTVRIGSNVTTAGLGRFRNDAGGSLQLLGTLDNTGQTLHFSPAGDENRGTLTLAGGRIVGGTVQQVGANGLRFSTNSGNTLDAVTVRGDLQLTGSSGESLTLLNGVTLTNEAGSGPGVANVTGSFAYLNFDGAAVGWTQTFDNATVNLGTTSGRLTVSRGGTLTLGPNVTVRGYGGVGNTWLTASGAASLVNQGTISADLNGRQMDLGTTSVNGGVNTLTNAATGVLEARNGGTLNIQATNLSNAGLIRVVDGTSTVRIGSNVTTAGLGRFRNDAGGSLQLLGTLDNTGQTLHFSPAGDENRGTLTLQGGRIVGGTVQQVGANGLRFAFNNANALDGVTVRGDLQLTGSSERLTLLNGVTLTNEAGSGPGVANVTGSLAYLNFDGAAVGWTQTFDNATVNLGTTSNYGYLTVSRGGTLTLGPNVTVRGYGGVGTTWLTASGAASLVNQGTISADLNARQMDLGTTSTGSGVNTLTNAATGVLEARNGGTLNIQATNLSNAGLIRVVDGTSTVRIGSNITTGGLGRFRNDAGGSLQLAGTLDNTGQTLHFSPAGDENRGTLTLAGGRIVGGTVQQVGANGLRFSSSTGTLDAVTVRGDLRLIDSNARLTLLNGVTLTNEAGSGPGVANVTGSSAYLNFDGAAVGWTQTFDNATVNLGTTSNYGYLTVSRGGTLTLGPNVTVRGYGGVGNTWLTASGAASLVNQGTISADLNGRQMDLGATSAGSAVNTLTNAATGFLEARNGGTLNIRATNLSNAGLIRVVDGTSEVNIYSNVTTGGLGRFRNDAGGSLRLLFGTIDNTGQTLHFSPAGDENRGTLTLQGGRIVGGTVQQVGANGLRFSTTGNTLDAVTVRGDLQVTGGRVTFVNGVALTNEAGSGPGVANVTSSLNFDGAAAGWTQTFDNATVNLGTSTIYAYLRVNRGGTLTLGPNATVRGYGGVGTTWDTASGAASLVNQGTISADIANFGALDLGTSSAGVGVNTLTNAATGVLEARNGGRLDIDATNITNFASGTLTGGTWRAVGNGSTVQLRTAGSVTTNAANLVWDGAGSELVVRNPTTGVTTTIESSLSTNTAAGAVRVLGGRSFTNSNAFANSGVVQLGGGSFTPTSISNAAGGEIFGFGTIGRAVVNSGTVRAAGGTLTASLGISGPAGTIQVDPGATLVLGTASGGGFLVNNGSLNLGAQNVVVSKDYTNANWGSGNSFDRRANVAGTGQVIGENAAQTITGAVTAAGPNTWTLNLGNVRGGSTVTVNYQIANIGTGADIRGAIQTAGANGGNITDPRLSGTGVTAGNFGPIAAGGNSGNLTVTFNAAAGGGSLAGQSIAVVSNFDNVATQIINLGGSGTGLAFGNATPNTDPVSLGSFRVGGAAPVQGFAVQNQTTGTDAERLGIGGVVASGNFSGSNNLGTGFIAPGASQAGAVTAQVSGGVAGVNSGSLTIQYTSNGELIDPSFSTINSNAQTINLQATGWNTAQGSASPSPINLGNFRVGVPGGVAPQSQDVAVSNAGGSFRESLGIGSASIDNTAFSLTNNLGSNLIAAGASNNAALTVARVGGQAGLNTGTLTIQYTSDGAGTSGLAAINANSQAITVNATGYNAAVGSATPAGPVNLGNVRIGGTLAQTFTVANTAPAGSFSEDLNASFGASSGAASHNGGSISGLRAGFSNGAAMGASLDTSSAGAKTGTVTIDYQTAGAVNGVSNGLGTASAGSQSITLNGNVFQLAQGQINTAPLNFGTVQVGQVVQQTLSISNVASGPTGFVEDLNASFGASSGTGAGQIFGTGSITGLAAGGTNASSMVVNVNTATAGTINGAIAVNFFSAGTVNGVSNGLGVIGVGSASYGVSGTIQSTGQVVDQAKPVTNGIASPNAVTVNLGNVRVGGTLEQTLSVLNQATGNPQAALNASIASNGAPVTASGSFNLLAPGATNGTDLRVGVNTASAGAKSGTATISFVSDASNIGNCAPNCQLNLPSQTVNVSGGVFQVAQPSVPASVDVGNFRLGSAPAAQAITIGNSNAAPAGYQEGLDASVLATGGKAVATGGPIVNLAQGATSTAIAVGIDNAAATAGVNSGTVTLKLASNGSGTSGLPSLDLANAVINVSGTGWNTAQGSATPSPINLGNFRVGVAGGVAPQSQDVAVSNAGGSFRESLGIGSAGIDNTAFSLTNNLGSNLIAAGASNNAALTVARVGGQAGLNTGTLTIQYTSDGAGTSGLAAINANSQAITVNATGYNAAVGSATPAGPVNLGNVRIGGTLAQTFTVANTAPAGSFSEDLNASFGASSGAASHNGGSISGLRAGFSNGAAMGASLDTSSAGAKTGTVTIDYQTAGAVNGVSNGLGTASAGSQSITLNGNVFQLAQGQINTAPLNFGTVQVGQVVQQTLSISNVASGPTGFVEDLNASFGASSGTGAGQIFGTGSITGLAAGGTNASSMVVNVNTATAGTINGAIAVNFFSAGTVNGVSNGLGVIGVGSASYGVSGTIQSTGQVVDQAKPVTNGIASPNAVTVNLGNVRVGGTLEQTLSVLNQATGNPQAALNASIASNGAPVTASGSFNLLAPGATNGTDLRVGVNTASAGAKSGTATISFVSDASNIGNCAPNCQLNLPSQTVNVSGGVFQVAQPSVPASVDVGNFRLGSAPAAQAITIGNSNAAPAGYQEGLDASVLATGGKAVASGGPIVNLAQGGTSTAIAVGIDNTAATAGVNSGTVTLKLASNGSGTSGLPSLDLANAVINVSGTGYRLANPTINNSPITIAARVGDAVAANRGVSITNSSPDIYTEGLKVSVNSASGNAQGAGSIANLAAQGTDSGSILVGLASTATAGLTSGTVSLNMISTGAGTTGAADEFLGTQNVTVNGKIYTPAVAQLVTTAVNFGIRRVGDAVAPVAVTVKNNAAATDLNDTLAATMGAVSSPFTGSGSVSGLGAGDTGSGTLIVGLATGNAGVFNGTASIGFASQNPDMADLDLGSLTVELSGQVNSLANPVFGKTGGAGSFGCSALQCMLDFGNLFVGSGPTSGILALTNLVSDPADDLFGSFDLTGLGSFLGSGFGAGPITLAAGESLGGLTLSFDALTEGLFTGSFVFSGASRNAFQSDLALADIKIFLRANVIPTGTVPEPGTISIVLLGAGLAFAARRRQAQRH